jgi:hypothetical protein
VPLLRSSVSPRFTGLQCSVGHFEIRRAESGPAYVTSEHHVEVFGTHASKTAKRGAAQVVVQKWAKPPWTSERNVRVGGENCDRPL